MSAPTSFDLNIDKVLPDWDVSTAIREFIANAIDESVLTGTSFPTITFENGLWVIRDFGRGIKADHLVFNENSEKKNNPKIIGKFGYGLKDAIAVLKGNDISFTIHSSNLSASFEILSKHGSIIKSIHAILTCPIISNGTEIRLNVDYSIMQRATNYFLYFAPVAILSDTKFGQVLDIPIGQPIPIYINGMRVALKNPDQLAFGYNITNLDKSIRDKLNRERKDLDWTIYKNQVVNILNNSKDNQKIISTLRQRYDAGYRDGEVNTKDIRALFMENNVFQIAPQEVNPALISNLQQNGIKFQIMSSQDQIVVSQLQKEGVDIPDIKDANNLISSIRKEVISPISESELTLDELSVLQSYTDICSRLGYEPVKPIINTSNDIWQGLNKGNLIYISRDCLKSKDKFLGTYLHEMIHYRTGHQDSTIQFEESLTNLIGRLASLI